MYILRGTKVILGLSTSTDIANIVSLYNAHNSPQFCNFLKKDPVSKIVILISACALAVCNGLFR